MTTPSMTSVAEHLARCLATVAPVTAQSVPLDQALGRTLAADVVSTLACPPFRSSSMDGYAIRSGEVHPGTPIPVAADTPAGPSTPARLPPRHVTRVMTGAPLPQGADAVIPVEWSDGGTEVVTFTQVSQPMAFVRPIGEDVVAGETVLTHGTALGPRQLALAAAVGVESLVVHDQARVAVLSTGDELVPPGRAVQFGQVYDANGPALVAAARQAGAEAWLAGCVPDTPEAVVPALHRVAADADLIVTTGGISAGAYDPVKAALRNTGTFWFGPVAMQPGLPQGVGVLELPATGRQVPVVTFPGNPVSALVSWMVFGRPMVAALHGGCGGQSAPPLWATAVQGWESPAGKTQYVRVTLRASETGNQGELPVAYPVGTQKSHLVADLAHATHLAIIPAEVTEVTTGMAITCLALD